MASYRASGEADEDLFDIWRYIAVRSSADRADRQGVRFHERFQFLAENPFIGRARPELAPGLRSFPVGSYLILYRPTDYGIEVVRVVHGSRDIEALFER
ncbi:MAG: type II toxin-antitoxin system RelE/ParE family toxin [Chloroflexi bacterium]|nr:type II toxin-antitoxin system RelE/ParE family toxin [Chloroflexota bacterium]